jgi:hypothetical protein
METKDNNKITETIKHRTLKQKCDLRQVGGGGGGGGGRGPFGCNYD